MKKICAFIFGLMAVFLIAAGTQVFVSTNLPASTDLTTINKLTVSTTDQKTAALATLVAAHGQDTTDTGGLSSMAAATFNNLNVAYSKEVAASSATMKAEKGHKIMAAANAYTINEAAIAQANDATQQVMQETKVVLAGAHGDRIALVQIAKNDLKKTENALAHRQGFAGTGTVDIALLL